MADEFVSTGKIDDGPKLGETLADNPLTRARTWRSDHPVDIRLTIPIPFFRVYVTLVGGYERRSPQRRGEERRRHPVRTFGNLLFLLATIVLFYGAFLGIVLAFSSIIEF